MEGLIRFLAAIWLWRWADRHDAAVREQDFRAAMAFAGADAHRDAWERYVEEWDTSE